MAIRYTDPFTTALQATEQETGLLISAVASIGDELVDHEERITALEQGEIGEET